MWTYCQPAVEASENARLAYPFFPQCGRRRGSRVLVRNTPDVKFMVLFHAPDSPITSNQPLERTADRREDLLLMTSTLKPEARLALVSGRSASSR
jgi:hypothetical protein